MYAYDDKIWIKRIYDFFICWSNKYSALIEYVEGTKADAPEPLISIASDTKLDYGTIISSGPLNLLPSATDSTLCTGDDTNSTDNDTTNVTLSDNPPTNEKSNEDNEESNEVNEGETPLSFMLLHLRPQDPPCIAFKLAFLGGTPGVVRQRVRLVAIIFNLFYRVSILGFLTSNLQRLGYMTAFHSAQCTRTCSSKYIEKCFNKSILEK